jgi:hypothetical protein
MSQDTMDSGKEDLNVDGDTYDEDTGDFLGRLTEGIEDDLTTLPAQVAVFFQGYWYIYKIDSRYKKGEENG